MPKNHPLVTVGRPPTSPVLQLQTTCAGPSAPCQALPGEGARGRLQGWRNEGNLHFPGAFRFPAFFLHQRQPQFFPGQQTDPVCSFLALTVGFPDGSVVKNPPAKAGDRDLIPGSGRSPG